MMATDFSKSGKQKGGNTSTLVANALFQKITNKLISFNLVNFVFNFHFDGVIRQPGGPM